MMMATTFPSNSNKMPATEEKDKGNKSLQIQQQIENNNQSKSASKENGCNNNSDRLITVFDDSKHFNVIHPLKHYWTLWYDFPLEGKNQSQEQYLSNVKILANTISSVEEFWSVFNNLPSFKSCPPNVNFHFFKSDMEPAWEHELNEGGGRWMWNTGRKMDRELLGTIWLDMMLAVLSEDFPGSQYLNGIMFQIRQRGDRAQMWLSSREEAAVFEALSGFKAAAPSLPENLGTASFSSHYDRVTFSEDATSKKPN